MELVQELYSKSAKKILQESMAISEKNPKISIMDRNLKNKKLLEGLDDNYKKWLKNLKNSRKEKFLDNNSRKEKQHLNAKSKEQNTNKEAAIKNEVSNNKRKLAKAQLKKCPYEENQTKLLTQNAISIEHGQSQFSPVELDTGKSLSEALLFAEHEENMMCTKNCSECQKQFLYITCSPQV